MSTTSIGPNLGSASDLLAAAGSAVSMAGQAGQSGDTTPAAGFLALIQQALGAATDAATGTLTGTADVTSDLVEGAADSVTDPATDLLGGLAGLLGQPQADTTDAADATDAAPTDLPEAATDLVNAALAMGMALTNQLTNQLSNQLSQATAAVSTVAAGAAGAVNTVVAAGQQAIAGVGVAAPTTAGVEAPASPIQTPTQTQTDTVTPAPTTSEPAASSPALDGEATGSALVAAPESSKRDRHDTTSQAGQTGLGLGATTGPANTAATAAPAPILSTGNATGTLAAGAEAATAARAQVFEKVTSLASRGNGIHRLTMTLNPGELGEVKVVMNVRDGVVHVRLAAGEHDTRAALSDGIADLHRLLESTGATDTRVTVRELGRELGRDLADQFRDDPKDPRQQFADADARQDSRQGRTWSDSPDQRAGTHVQHGAMDGHPTTARSGLRNTASELGSAESVTSRSGVDVTM